MNAPSYDIATILVNELDMTIGTDLFMGREPTTPPNCVTIFDTPGAPPDFNYIKGTMITYPAIQIRVRNVNYTTGWGIINNIKKTLHNRGNEVINGTTYLTIACSQEPALLDWDENNRARFVVSFNLSREEE